MRLREQQEQGNALTYLEGHMLHGGKAWKEYMPGRIGQLHAHGVRQIECQFLRPTRQFGAEDMLQCLERRQRWHRPLWLDIVIILIHWTMFIALVFRRCEQGFAGVHGIQQATLIDEGNQHHGLPIMFLAIEITLEFRWIELSQGTAVAEHECVIGLGQEAWTGRR